MTTLRETAQDLAPRTTWRDTPERDAEELAARSRVTQRPIGSIPVITLPGHVPSFLELMGASERSNAMRFIYKMEEATKASKAARKGVKVTV